MASDDRPAGWGTVLLVLVVIMVLLYLCGNLHPNISLPPTGG